MLRPEAGPVMRMAEPAGAVLAVKEPAMMSAVPLVSVSAPPSTVAVLPVKATSMQRSEPMFSSTPAPRSAEPPAMVMPRRVSRSVAAGMVTVAKRPRPPRSMSVSAEREPEAERMVMGWLTATPRAPGPE